jgi:hypothetical protein
VSEERSTRLMLSCTNSEVITHPGGRTFKDTLMIGHFLPSAANRKHEMVAFIKKYLLKDAQVNGETNGAPTLE